MSDAVDLRAQHVAWIATALETLEKRGVIPLLLGFEGDDLCSRGNQVKPRLTKSSQVASRHVTLRHAKGDSLYSRGQAGSMPTSQGG